MTSCEFPVLYGPPPADYDLSINCTQMDFPSEGGTAGLKIVTDDQWKISKKADYVRLSATSGKGTSYVYVIVSENNQSQTRATYLIVSGIKGGVTQQVQIWQERASSYIFIIQTLI